MDILPNDSANYRVTSSALSSNTAQIFFSLQLDDMKQHRVGGELMSSLRMYV